MNFDQFLAATGVSESRAAKWYEPVEHGMFEFAIVSTYRAAAYLATLGHETMGFVYTKELWGPTPAQRRYEGRADLGNTQPGDGSLFRGRGLIQITGRANYLAVSKGLGVDFVENPKLLETDEYAARSAAWWWANNGCNALADTGDFLAVSRRVNLGNARSSVMPNGWADRQQRYERALAVL